MAVSHTELFSLPVVLTLPAHAGLIRLARLLASGIATTLDVPVDAVEDLRIAVDEGCAALVEAADGGPITVSFAVDGDRLVVSGRAASASPADPDRLSVSRRILDEVTDDHTITTDGGQIHFRIWRTLTPTDGR